jgi:hypothetical protein
MERLGPTLKPYDLLPRQLGGPATTPSAPAKAVSAASASEPDSDFRLSFDDLLDVVNPLQHLPVIGTLYRAVTHDRIRTPEKIAGDTLFGGVWGLVSSLADTAFEKITGHNFGDTVLALFTGHHADTPVVIAAAKPPEQPTAQAGAPAAAPDQPAAMDVAALSDSLTRAGVRNDIAQRALYAYRRSNELTGQATPSPF